MLDTNDSTEPEKSEKPEKIEEPTELEKLEESKEPKEPKDTIIPTDAPKPKHHSKSRTKKPKYNDNAVYIGKRPTMNYVMASMVILNRGVNCTIKACGRAISHAVDVAEILKNKFYPTAKYQDIKLSTEHLKNDDGKVSNVSSMEIVISPN